MDIPSFIISNPVQRFMGFLFFLALGWFVIFKPAWFGLKQALGRVDPTAEAMAGIRGGLKTIFGDIKALAQASVPELVAKVALSTLEDLFSGRATEAAKDAALLVARAQATYHDYQALWAPHLEALEGYPAPKLITVVHGFWTWLQAPEVMPVFQAAGRRLGLGEDVAEERRLKLQNLLAAQAPDLAYGFWYGLYATVMLQFLILEGFYVWGRTRSLFWAACALVAFNMIKGMLLLADMARVWPVREEVRSIAAALGIPNMLDYALRLLGGQALGVVTMLLIVVRFVALGEALHRPGYMLAGVHGTMVWIWGFYLEMARVIF